MARKQKVTPTQLQDIKRLWELKKHTNTHIAELYAEEKVTEKNIRDWAKANDWERHKKPKLQQMKPKTKGVKKKISDASKKSKENLPRDARTTESVVAKEAKGITAEKLDEVSDVVVTLIIQGEPKHTIKTFLQRKYNISKSMFDMVYEHSADALANSVEKNMNARFAYHVEARKVLIRKFSDKNDFNGVLRVLSDLARVEGMYPKEPLVNINTMNTKEVVLEAKIPDEYKADHFVENKDYQEAEIDTEKDDNEG